MIYLFVRPMNGRRGPVVFGYSHLGWPERIPTRRIIWCPLGETQPE